LVFLSGIWSHAQSIDSLVKNFVNNKALSGAKISLLAVEVSNSDTLLSYQPNLVTAPASTTKLFSTAMALEIFGK
jgi:D-alanyl-D-alanine carboxypeptidase